jgi:hypothetical protein
MSKKLRDQAAKAKGRHQRRKIAPDVEVTIGEQGWSYGNPYRGSDELAWCSLFFEAFGTRQGRVANTFINHLARLCQSKFDRQQGHWAPNEDELATAIALVQSFKPRNEAEAAMAAQAVALHFTAMKVGRQLADHDYADPRTASSLARLSQAYAQQIETLHKLKGRKTSRQKITVSYEKHEHKHVHFDGGGSDDFGGRVHDPRRTQIGEHAGCAALPRPNSKVVPLPVSRDQGQEALSASRRKVGSA